MALLIGLPGIMEDCRKGYGRSNFCVGDCSENTVRFTNNKTLLHYSNLIHVFNTRRGVQTACVNRRRASNTGRGSEPFVPIDAGGFYSRKYGIFGLELACDPTQNRPILRNIVPIASY